MDQKKNKAEEVGDKIAEVGKNITAIVFLLVALAVVGVFVASLF